MRSPCRTLSTGLALSLALAAALAGAACSARVPPTHYYVLESREAIPAPPASEGATVGVRPFRVDPPYDQDRIVYRVGADTAEVGFYAYHRWAAPLARMIPSVVADELSGIDGVRAIEPVAIRRSYDYLVDGRLSAFEEVDDAEGPRVRIRLELRVSDADGNEVWSGPLAHDARVDTKEVETIAEALRSGLEQAVAGSRDALAGAFSTSTD